MNSPDETPPEVLFVCTHNAGRSQMAAALLDHLAAGTIRVSSAGSRPASQLNPAVVAAMSEIGVDITSERPKLLDPAKVRAADVVITMGCGDACPVYPGKRYLDWDLPDPAGLPLDQVRPIRDAIATRVRDLIADLTPPPRSATGFIRGELPRQGPGAGRLPAPARWPRRPSRT